jgi:hypothetical protein
MPIVSIIIVNWNGEAFLRDCFHSLQDQTYKDFEVIFVDNASTDNSVSVVKELVSSLDFPIKLIELSENTGFTGGNIEGLKHCSGKYIALLNNDTVATDRWLEALVRAMDVHPEVGICASKLIVAGTDIIDSAGDGYATFGRAFKRGEGLPHHLFDKEEYVFGACGGAALYRKQMLDEIGFFDDDLFLYFEDSDLNFRAQLSGWKCLFVPEAVVYHRVRASGKKIGHLSAFYGVRNDKIVKIKNVPLTVILRHFPCFILNELISFAYHVRTGQFKSYLKGNYEFLKNLPHYLKKRKQVMELKKVTSGYINSLLTSGFTVYLGKYLYKIKN